MALISNQEDLELNWVWVFNLKEFLQYFKNNEIFQLSTLCKILHQKLTPIIFKSLDLYDYCPDNDDGIMDGSNFSSNEIINCQIKELNLMLAPMRPYIMNLTLGRYFNYSLMVSTIMSVKSLRDLSLFLIKLPLPNLIQLFQDLNNIEILQLYQIQVFVRPKDVPYMNNLILPKSLKKLRFQFCERVDTDISNDPFEIYTYDPSGVQGPMQFPPQHLPNLEEIIWLDYNQLSIPVLNQMLSNNPQVRRLETYIELLTQQLLNILRNSQLTNLKITNYSDRFDHIASLHFPKLLTITSLDLLWCENPNREFLKKICESCPNLTQLKLVHLPGISSVMRVCFSELIHLKHLVISDLMSSRKFLLNHFAMNQLINIELLWFNPLKVDLRIFKNCRELKRVKIKWDTNNRRELKKLQRHWSQFPEWKSLTSKEYIYLYKQDTLERINDY